jgi:hypothetical protein
LARTHDTALGIVIVERHGCDRSAVGRPDEVAVNMYFEVLMGVLGLFETEGLFVRVPALP